MTRITARRGLASLAVKVAVAFVAFVVVSVVVSRTQAPISHNGGLGWDGVHYHVIAEQFARGERPEAPAPFVYRIGTPWLVAALFEHDLVRGFRNLNLVANALAVMLLVAWLRLWITSAAVRFALLALFLTHWLGPVRFVFFYPVYTDPWLFVVLLAGLLVLGKFRDEVPVAVLLALTVLSFVGVLFRELALLVPLAVLFTGNPLRLAARSGSPLRWTLLLPLIGGTVALLLVGHVATPTTNHSFVKTAWAWLYDKPWLTYVYGWFVTFGLLVCLPLLDVRRTRSFLAAHQPLLAYLVACAAVSYAGGSDTERLLFLAMPVVYVLGTISRSEPSPVRRRPRRDRPEHGADSSAAVGDARLSESFRVGTAGPDAAR